MIFQSRIPGTKIRREIERSIAHDMERNREKVRTLKKIQDRKVTYMAILVANDTKRLEFLWHEKHALQSSPISETKSFCLSFAPQCGPVLAMLFSSYEEKDRYARQNSFLHSGFDRSILMHRYFKDIYQR